MSSNGLVSIIVPVFNRPRLVREAVASALAQTYRPIEVLAVDDGSTDDTSEVLAAIAAEHPEVTVLRQPNAGPGAARELGRGRAKGEFLQYLDSDDLLLPQKLEWQVAGLREHPECGVSYGWTRYRFADGSVHPHPWKGSGQRVHSMFPSFLLSRWWDTPTPLYRASLCAEAGPWLPLKQEEDWELDCRMAALGVRLHHVPAYVCEVRDHGEGRLCVGAGRDPALLADRARAHAAIFRHARDAGIPADAAEMKHFARALFLLCRQCGRAGLAAESALLHQLACVASSQQDPPWDLRLYGTAARLMGWHWTAALASLTDRVRA